jgi:tRNA 5-methylaminomethyl-2-thiouridine biosynthesis bifunctional protein
MPITRASSMFEPLIPATLAFAESGTPYSARYGDVYHSDRGGPGQASHVFLAGNRLPARWRDRERFVILETGFGTGLNFLATWRAWRDDPYACRRLHYLSVEKHPFRVDDLARIHAAWPEFSDLAARLRDHWPLLTPGFHRLEFEGGRLILTLLLGDAAATLPKLSARVDAIYLDGFSPGRNPDIWSPELLRRIGEMANEDATLATWSVSGQVRAALQNTGFALEKETGFAGKREMLVGRHVGPRSSASSMGERRAMVIGAGVAGATCCERLASRGWEVTLVDRREGPAMAASGNLAGILMPLVSKDDNIASRLSRTALLYALRSWHTSRAGEAGARLGLSGVFQIARDAEQERLQQAVVETLRFPPEFVSYLDPRAAESFLGHPVPAGGWLFRHAGWANPPSLCRASLNLAGDRVRTLFSRTVVSLAQADGLWRALDASGRPLAEAPVMILANGHEAIRFDQAAPLPIRRLRGQVTLIPEGLIPTLRSAVCREGYATPAVDGLHAVGASYDLDDDPEPRLECTLGNLQRLANLLPGIGGDLPQRTFSDRVGFRPVPPDRLPIMGPLPDWSKATETTTDTRLRDLPRLPGLYGLMGYASRGLVWAQLLAEALACRLEDEPAPMETDLLAAIDPGRFLIRDARRGKAKAGSST